MVQAMAERDQVDAVGGGAAMVPCDYPSAWLRRFVARGDIPLVIRPMQPDDEPRVIAFHTALSEQSVYWRYFRTMPLQTRIAHDRLVTVCKPNHACEAVLVAEWTDPVGQRHIVGIGRLEDLPGSRNEACEFAVIVADAWQGRGIGRRLLAELVEMARAAGRRRIVGDILPDNTHMQRMVQSLGFDVAYEFEDRVSRARLRLGDPASV